MASDPLDRVLSCPSLPTLPTVALELLQLISDPHVKLEAIEKLVQSDQGLATRVLRTVNSSFYGLTKRCTTIKRAIQYLGLNAVKSVVLGLSLVDLTKSMGDTEGLDLRQYWRRVLFGATASRVIAELIGCCDPDEAFTGAMFQDIGVLAAFMTLEDEYGDVLAAAGEDHDALIGKEREMLGFDHCVAGAALAERWQMPEELVACVEHHHAPQKAPPDSTVVVQVVALGRIAAQIFEGETTAARATARLLGLCRAWFSHEIDTAPVLQHISEAAEGMARVMDQNLGKLPQVNEIMAQVSAQMVNHQASVEKELEALRQEREDLSHAAKTDGLTGVANRTRFDEIVLSAFKAARSGDTPLSVLFADADRFKTINDTHGHQVGDTVLIEIARRLEAATGADGTVCRYGGEEFAVVLPGADADTAARIAERIRSSVEQTAFDLSGIGDAPPSLTVTVSIGVASRDVECVDASQLVRLADEAVYAAKKAGRNCVQVHASEAVKTTTPTRRDGYHVLLVENDPLAATLLSTLLLRKPKVSVTCVQGVGAALNVLRSDDPPHVVIADLNLDDGLGIDLLNAMKANPAMCLIPFIAITAARPEDLSQLQAAGAVATFTKQQLNADLPRWIHRVFTEWVKPSAA